MSLVGPKPLYRNSVNLNKKAYWKSLKMKPGITGPFQTNRGDYSLEHVIALNDWYFVNHGFTTDLMIIIKTPLIIIRQKLGVKKTFLII